MPTTGDDCFFYYHKTCMKGVTCPFRHCPEALGSETECPLWRQARCFTTDCKMRHMEIPIQRKRQVVACYWENQPSGCQRSNCMYRHCKPRIVNGTMLEPDAQAADTATGAPPAGGPAPARSVVPHHVSGQNTPNDSPVPSPAPKVQKVVINFDEESDADSVQGTPVKQAPIRLQEIKVPTKPTFLSTRKGPSNEEDISSENLSFEVKSLEELRREKVRLAKQLLEEAEKELMESGAPLETPPPAPREARIRMKMSPPEAAPAKITLGKLSSPEDITIKSLEEIRREQALATLNRGGMKRKFAVSAPDRQEEPSTKMALFKPSPESREGKLEGDLEIKSLEEIRREQALASMRKRVAEKELAKKQAEEERSKLAAVSRTSSVDSLDEESPAPTTVTRRIVIASEDDKKPAAPKAPLSSRLGGRKITVAANTTAGAAGDVLSVKSRLGIPGGIKRRLGVNTQTLTKNMENVENVENERRRRRRQRRDSSVSSVSSSEVFSDDEVIEKPNPQPKAVPEKRKLNIGTEPVITRKITLGSKISSNDQVTAATKRVAPASATANDTRAKKKRRAEPIQLYKAPAWQERRGENPAKTDSSTDESSTAARPAKGGRKPMEWGVKSYGEIIREKQLTKAASSANSAEEKARRISPISFNDQPSGISPVMFIEKPPRSVSPEKSGAHSPVRITSRSAASSPNQRRDRSRMSSPNRSRDRSGVSSPNRSRDRTRVSSTIRSRDRSRPTSPIRSRDRSDAISPIRINSTSDSHAMLDRKDTQASRKPVPRKGPKLVWSTRVPQPTITDAKIVRVSPPVEDTSVRLKPTRKLTLNTKKISAEVKPSPIRPAFMRAKPQSHQPEEENEEKAFIRATSATPSLTESSSRVQVPTQAALTPKSAAVSKTTPAQPRRRHSRGSVSSSKSAASRKATAGLEDLGQEMDLLDDDLIDLFTDDAGDAGRRPVTSTATDDDELLAQMEEFLA